MYTIRETHAKNYQLLIDDGWTVTNYINTINKQVLYAHKGSEKIEISV